MDDHRRFTNSLPQMSLDMQWSAVQYVQGQLQVPVAAIATLQDLLHYLQSTASEELAPHLQRVTAYRERYGV